jgi:NodT family efflux transporter outer membrane factor (OMF) lipoprotein
LQLTTGFDGTKEGNDTSQYGYMMSRKPTSSCLLALGLLGGCAPIPDLGARLELRQPSAKDAAISFAGPAKGWPSDAWWRDFADPVLDGLMIEALAGSPDIAQATARINAADALSQQSGAALLPNVTGDASVAGNQQSQNLGIPPQFVPDGIRDTGRIGVSAAFNLDLWGKNRAALAATTSEAVAARVDAAQTRLILTTSLASAYADLAQLYRTRDVAQDSLKVRETTVALTAQRVKVGVDTRGSLRQAEARVPIARGDIIALDESIALTRNRIAALLGAGPDRGLSIVRPKMRETSVGIPEGADLALIGRRPDIVAARLRAEAASQRINVAQADFYPNISLSAAIGLQSLGLGRLVESGSTTGNGGAALSLPIFDGGRIAGRYRGAHAEYDGAVARYDATLIAALREIADLVVSSNATDARLKQSHLSLAAAEAASDIAILRYKGGLSNQLQVLVTADALLASRRTTADLEARRRSLEIMLIRALGGGFRATPLGDQ